ncbi:T9SS type A sorting domain-containing protein [Flavobacterium psychrophilum]|uniref:T9SS type A sorting domain-containing protein n=1 Tax=Flavobacterium psychrophilum TaxID=96345 RepID=A0A7U2NGQ6_FLAPS|nr:T9SS type A sorting domain-containing protein [Flavobacterium psychrophilum]QRE04904.1 T9SS type A sorting domain-containing protein [Flavobacterium psychrophilum]
MKKNTLILLLLFTFTKINAQLVNEEIDFNNLISTTNNDLFNKFVQPIPYGYEQITDGNSGYYLATSLQGAATQPLKLCSKFKGIDTESMIISIDYKVETYPTPISFGSNSVGVFIAKNNGETVLSTRLSANELSINGLTNPNSTFNSPVFGANFVNGRWYRLIFQLTKIATDKFSITSKIYDIGLDGTSSPVLKVTNSKEGFNYYFNSANDINIHIVGGWWGNVKYLDNFKIYGFKNGSNCPNLSNNNFNLENNIVVYPNPFTNQIILNKEATKINIYNLNGQLISTHSNVNKEISVEKLASGIYFFEIFSNDGVQIKKLIKN